MVIEAPGGAFTLTARADRIDFRDAGLVITDYKTGTLPQDNRVLAGRAPQLLLEAAIVAAEGSPTSARDPSTRSATSVRPVPSRPARSARSGLAMAPADAARASLTRLIALRRPRYALRGGESCRLRQSLRRLRAHPRRRMVGPAGGGGGGG